MTDDTPRHNARIPSVDDIRVKAFPIPEYTAAGEVAKTCIRVWIRRPCLVSRVFQSEVETSDFDAVNGKHDGVF